MSHHHNHNRGSKHEERTTVISKGQATRTPTPPMLLVPAKPDVNEEAAKGIGPQKLQAVSDDEVRQLAYAKWQAAGCPECDGIEFWLEAERDLK